VSAITDGLAGLGNEFISEIPKTAEGNIDKKKLHACLIDSDPPACPREYLDWSVVSSVKKSLLSVL